MLIDSGASGNFITQKYINGDGRLLMLTIHNQKQLNLQMDQQLKQIKY